MAALFFYLAMDGIAGMRSALEPELNSIERRFLDLCRQVVSDSGLELYDFNYNASSGLLQVFIVNPETGTALIEDCVKVDRGFDAFLEEDWLPENLTLEVSSPGVYRALVTASHFDGALNQPIQLLLKKRFEEIVEGCPKKFKGQKKVKMLLVAQDETALTLKYNDSTFTVPFEVIKKANLESE